MSADSPQIEPQPKPFLRWAGGKRTLVPTLLQILPKGFNGLENRFFEPFVGGGAFSIALGNSNSTAFVPGSNLYINDINPELAITYKVIRDDVEMLIRRLRRLSTDLSEDAFLRIRKSSPDNDIARAARFIYLNKTCFNGLWRVNSRGEFNVPWGKSEKVQVLDEENLRLLAKRLAKCRVSNKAFSDATKAAMSGDLVYFDPPYVPLSATSSFSSYAKEGFTLNDQRLLAEHIQDLTSKKVHVILSNSDTELTREIFSSLYLYKKLMRRSISAKGDARLPVYELVATNYIVKKKIEGLHSI